jgi:hypothetical protein
MSRFLGATVCALWTMMLGPADLQRQRIGRRFQLLGTITVGVATLWQACVATPVWAQTYAGRDLFILTSPFPNQPPPQISINDGSPSVAAGGLVVGEFQGGPNVSPISDALVWASPNGDIVNLTPTNLQAFPVTSFADGTDGARQVGGAGEPGILGNGGFTHAFLWNGTADSGIDLHPVGLTGITNSYAIGISGNQQTGVGYNSSFPLTYHALVWNGTAASAVDLHPNISGFDSSIADGTDGVRQVGEVENTITRSSHALVWSGTAATAADLNPTNLPGFDFSIAYGVNGKSIVGDGGGIGIGDFSHALLWTAGADSAIDLQPTKLSGVFGSVAYNTDGIHQVGYGLVDLNVGSRHALLWSGTADSAIDLNLLLPFDSVDSVANTIDAQGNIWGTATDSDGNIHAVEWSPVPEPTSIVIALMGSILTFPLLRRRKSHSANSAFPAILPHSLHSPQPAITLRE